MYARLVDGVILDPIPATSQEDVKRFFHPKWLESVGGIAAFTQVPDSAKHGAKSNGDGTYTNPPQPTPILAWDEFDFRKRFTAAERKAIKNAAKSNSDIEDFIDMLVTAGRTGTRIKANDSLLNEAMNALEAAGLIAAGRKEEILGL